MEVAFLTSLQPCCRALGNFLALWCLSCPICTIGFSETQPCKRTGWAQSSTWLAPETQGPFLESFLGTLGYCSNDRHADPGYSLHPVYSPGLLPGRGDTGLLQPVNTLVGHSGVQIAHSAAQHSFRNLHGVSGFDLVIHHTSPCTATTLPVLEAAGQGQAL